MKHNIHLLALGLVFLISCQPNAHKGNNNKQSSFAQGTFGYDLEFLKTKDSVVVLGKGDAQVIVSPRYQGKVFTSTAMGMHGKSFGWLNYQALGADSIAAHINAYGGEDRMWLAPEGGQYSIFFKAGTKMVFDNWQTPAALDTEPWETVSVSETMVSMQKNLKLQNYSGTQFDVSLQRNVKLLTSEELLTNLGTEPDTELKWVGFETNNTLTNAGTKPWTKETGTLSIWVLSMLNPIENGAVVIPYRTGDEKELGPVATTGYFGEIPPQRIQMKDGVVYFKADGKYRSKLGISYKRATPIAGSYDINSRTLTVMQFLLPPKEELYINQLWEIQKEPFKGDVINAYNDGPLDAGGQLGPFYELESSSPAAFLAPGTSISHMQRIYHFTGPEQKLNQLCKKTLGVSLEQIKTALDK
jgi:hypothetical protein